MNKTLEKAILLTYEKYNIRQVKGAMKAAINKGETTRFTNDQNARAELNIKDKDEFRNEIFDQYLMYVVNSEKAENDLERAIKDTYEKYKKGITRKIIKRI